MSTLRSELSFFDRFAEPVADFEHSRSAPLVCLVSDREGTVHFIGQGRRGVRAGTRLRRLNISNLVELTAPFRLSSIVELLPPRYKSPLRRKLESGGLLTPNQFGALADALVQAGSEAGQLLARYSLQRAGRISALSPRVRQQLAQQKEALGAALSFSGFERKVFHDWAPPDAGEPASFLDGLPQARLREDAMIANDLAVVPGFSFVRPIQTGAALFENDLGTRLTVVLANRLPLEELTGADLVYYNETFASFVMVQYKAMERGSDGEAVYRLPNTQLDEEIRRMDRLIESVRSAALASDVADFRLAWNPFFIKLCPRLVFEPDNAALSKGMYLPIEKWKLLMLSSDIVGPRRGRGITFRNVKRYMDNTAFISLVANAWIGTHREQSAVLESAVRGTVESGRAVVLAVKRTTAADRESE